ncbi:hypothetical protein [Pedobacter psychroterrae]|uniref:hypothetical protein n=1 Tax=Pedobacter psychroterrae TaxID=2530453 RepID=UPI0013F178AD|nr:hypothetical protein [Pedobacter psychroterrae]
MRKVLLSVMTVGFLLAFNACKKGDQGPIGPSGPTGAAGAAGQVGPAGAAGADGSKILTGAGAPAAATGANGDFYFDSTAKSLYGPKAGGAWPATGVVLSGPAGAAGANGATGATGATGTNGSTGAAGTKFLAGAGAPGAAIGSEGDFYFDTTNSVFYGPKGTGATPWAASAGSNVMPIGRAYAAKTFYLTRGFEGVTEVTKTYGQVANVSYGMFDIITTYTINSDDEVRIANYPGWSDNREMAFENTAGSGVFDKVPTSGNQLNPASGAFDADFSVGRRFIYTNNTANPTTTFALTQIDIDRLTANNGAAFGYLTYAKVTTSPSNPGNSYMPANPSLLTPGGTMNFARTKNVAVTSESGASANYNATYTAQTRLNINTIPGLGANIEKYKQEGKVFVKYKYFTSNTAGNNPENHAGTNAGWVDITPYANSYVKAVSYGVDNSDTNPTLFPGPFNAPAYTSGMGNPFAGGPNFMGTANIFGNAGTTVTLATNQTAAAVTTASTVYNDGEVVINWNINSGTNFGNATTTYSFGPTTIPSVTVVGNTGTRAPAVARGFEDDFYSGAQLTSTPAGQLDANGDAQLVLRTGGRPASYFSGTKLVQVQVFVIPGDVIKTAKAKGVDVNNAAELGKYISLNK